LPAANGMRRARLDRLAGRLALEGVLTRGQQLARHLARELGAGVELLGDVRGSGRPKPGEQQAQRGRGDLTNMPIHYESSGVGGVKSRQKFADSNHGSNVTQCSNERNSGAGVRPFKDSE